MPRVSVVMSVYNGERHLAHAIDSILGQTFTDFEFVIVNDGSTDDTATILEKYTDLRIRIIEQANAGHSAALNRGIAAAAGELIARMDADDVSLPRRLQKTISLIDATGAVAVGTGMRVIDEGGDTRRVVVPPASDLQCRRLLARNTPFAHGSVMMRRDVVIAAGGYRENLRVAEDYELWSRLAEFGTFANVPEQLYVYRLSTGGLTARNLMLQQEIRRDVQRRVLMRPLPRISVRSLRHDMRTPDYRSDQIELVLHLAKSRRWRLAAREATVMTIASPSATLSLLGRVRRKTG